MPVIPNGVSVRVPKTAELVAGYIRRRIVIGELSEGDSLPSEVALMTEFTVSRPTLREAFRILESEGLITIRRGAQGGARVQEPSVEVTARYAGLVLQHRGATLSDVLAARTIVEAPAAGMVAARRDRRHCAEDLRGLLSAAEADPGHIQIFNGRVVELAGNQSLVLVTAMFEDISTKATLNFALGPLSKPAEDARLARRGRRSRNKLIDLIAAGDDRGAEAHWRAHLSEAGRALVERVGDSVLALFD